ncbi:MAG: LptF/LptG family permease, partial [Longimicrobiales bacterium]
MIGRRILDRYVLGEFLRLFVSFCLSTPALFILGDLTDNLDSFRARDLTGAQIVLNYIYQLPLFVLYAFPIAALIATVFTVNAMTRHSEIAAAKAGGVSFQRLYGALPLLGVVLTFAALGLSELVPITNRLRAEATGQAESGTAARGDFIYREQDGHVYAIRQLLVENERIYGLTVEREGNEPAVPGLEIVAQQAVYGGGEARGEDDARAPGGG